MKNVTTNSFSAVAFFIAATFSLLSCSENTDSKVVVPQFSGITFSSDLTAGNEVTATAVQYKKGKYLDRTTYKWTFEGAQQIGGGEAGVFYDSNKSNPSCSIILPETPGQYTITMLATYNTSAKIGNSVKEVDIKGGTITYTTSPITCTVMIKQNVRVVAK